jgi:hypothetical protein
MISSSRRVIFRPTIRVSQFPLIDPAAWRRRISIPLGLQIRRARAPFSSFAIGPNLAL